MKNVSMTLAISAIVCPLLLGSASAALAKSTCTVRNLFSGVSYTRSGSSYAEATATAMEECRSEQGEGCVRVSCVSSDPSDGIDPRGYACHSSDKIGRTWDATASTMNAARAAAIAECESDAGVGCKISSCSMVF